MVQLVIGTQGRHFTHFVGWNVMKIWLIVLSKSHCIRIKNTNIYCFNNPERFMEINLFYFNFPKRHGRRFKALQSEISNNHVISRV